MNVEIEKFKSYLTSIIPIDDKTFNLALDYLIVKKIKKSDYLLREGNICNQISYVNSGLFRIFYLKDGNEINTCFCKENSIASSLDSFVNKTFSKESIQAIENSTTVSLSNEGLIELYKLDPIWQSLSRILTEKECGRLSSRVNTLNFETALEKYLYLIENQPEIIQRVSVQHIASYIGVSRETLSRIRSKIF